MGSYSLSCYFEIASHKEQCIKIDFLKLDMSWIFINELIMLVVMVEPQTKHCDLSALFNALSCDQNTK